MSEKSKGERKLDSAAGKDAHDLMGLVDRLKRGDSAPHWKMYKEGILIPPDTSSERLAEINSISITGQADAVLRRLENENNTWAVKSDSLSGHDKEIWLPGNEMRMWSVSRNAGMFLYWLANRTGARDILELGTSAGYSAIWMALGIRENNGTVYTIDLSDTKVEMAKGNFKEAGIDNVRVINARIDDTLENWSGRLDMVFFDADTPSYGKYLKLALPHINAGGYIVVDNVVKHFNDPESLSSITDFVKMLRGEEHKEILHGHIQCLGNGLENGLYIIRKNKRIDVEQIMSFFGS
ncbi:MAG: class I SAM-dependent methyltransferase [Candidatus Micrarchaeota archaeon]|nr:class I SAM-dependent methyltransferase [Candidatus Micrarchaeota archaeon]